MNLNLKLNPEEQAIMDGKSGEVLAKAMKSIVLYGEAFGATKLVDIVGDQHLVTSFGANTIKPYFAMMDELINAGLKARAPFTVDPRPTEYTSVNVNPLVKLVNKLVFGKQAEYEIQLQKLGLKNENAFTCACYLPEVGNTPEKGAMLAWSESSAVVFANSVLGARTNRNSAGIDILCAILGKAPYFGFLTDEGRKATWKIEVKTSKRPNAQLLGSAIGLKVMEAVPYITGLERFLGNEINAEAQAFLKDMGAATASNGAVGLYHVENVTPEAKDLGEKLLAKGYQTYVIDDAELERVHSSYPVLWKDLNAVPKRIFIGCPHLNRTQLEGWIARIEAALKEYGRTSTVTPVALSTAPDIADLFRSDAKLQAKLKAMNLSITTICPLMYMNNPLGAIDPIATNSNKLRTYSSARFYPDDEILELMCTGTVKKGGK
ncbi:MAG: aconitase X [Anaerolineaceae bacterium]|nr:aconitase X [Anaerolineaceae bacterium]